MTTLAAEVITTLDAAGFAIVRKSDMSVMLADMWNELYEYQELRLALSKMTDEGRESIKKEWKGMLAHYSGEASKP